jgi:RNase H-like domain found in reverse transcriptase
MQKAFNNLKKRFIKALILIIYNLKEDFILKMDALNKAINKCLS